MIVSTFTRMQRPPAIFPVLAFFLLAGAPSLCAQSPPALNETEVHARLDPFLSEYCYGCHDDDLKKGDLDLFSTSFDLSHPETFATWQRVWERVREGEMPPRDRKKQPGEAESAAFLQALEKPLKVIDRADRANAGRVHVRRLTRQEYQNTLQDLLGIDLPLADILPEEPVTDGFETVADGQQFSHHHMARYLEAADVALEEAFRRATEGDGAAFKKVLSPQEICSAQGAGNFRGPQLRDGKAISWAMSIQFSGRIMKTAVPESGTYRVTIHNLRAINPGPDGVVWGAARGGSNLSNEPVLHYLSTLEATTQPQTHSFTGWMEQGHCLQIKPLEGAIKRAATGGPNGNISYQGRDLQKQGFQGLAMDKITIERIHPNGSEDKVRRVLLDGIRFSKGKLAPQAKTTPDAALEQLLRRFARQVFRRPATSEQLAPYLALARARLADGVLLQDALKDGYRALLCSPRFLTFADPVGPLDSHSLAARLSYTLWNSLPDAPLAALADQGKLTDPKVYRGEVARLLAHPRAERFITGFTDQWLDLRAINFTSPDQRLFRKYDPVVQDSLLAETRSFFRELIRNDLSVTHFIQSDFAMLNGRLRRHYKLPETIKTTPGNGIEKVSLGPGHPRGGLITQGSVLKVTADGTTTSPILRGIWVNERLLGRHVPPPPPGIPAVEPDIRGAVSIRDQLDKHRSEESCASCHAKIDPAGFALEVFDPVGVFRTAYGPKKTSAKVDPSGVTPDGTPFAGLREWKAHYLKQPERMAAAFAQHFLTYATGAPLRFSDRLEVEALVEEVGKKGHGVRSLIEACLESPVFLSK